MFFEHFRFYASSFVLICCNGITADDWKLLHVLNFLLMHYSLQNTIVNDTSFNFAIFNLRLFLSHGRALSEVPFTMIMHML